jgi:Flp pilus assembly protein TadG
MTALRALLSDCGGQAIVEFALTSSLVFFVMFGIVDFARAMHAYDVVASAARLGTRYAIVHGTACPTAPTCTATSTQVQTYVRSAVGGLDASNLTVSTTWPVVTGCVGAATPGCPVRVSVTYPFSFVFSLNLTIAMSASSQMTISQ